MARVSGHPTSASPGQKQMTHTVQCPHCGVVLNVPAEAAGRRLKCPKCETKFPAPATFGPGDSAIAGPSPASSLFPARGNPGSGGRIELPTSPASLRETFDLPLLAEATPGASRPPPSTSPVADALALFQDEPKSARRPRGAEARAQARRCPTCGNVVPIGMSLCSKCGLDLDTGRRVASMEIFEEAPAPSRPESPSMGIFFVGGLCAVGNLLLAVVSLVAWYNGHEGMQFLLVVWLFGIYAAVQFLRRRSIRPLFVALSLAVGIGVVLLIALPIIYANMPTDSGPIVDNPGVRVADPAAPDLRPITVDMNKIGLGVASLLAYAAVSVYLNSPAMRRHFRH